MEKKFHLEMFIFEDCNLVVLNLLAVYCFLNRITGFQGQCR